MGYNKKTYIETKDFFEKKHKRAGDLAFARREEIHSAIPEIRDIDRELSGTCSAIVLEIAKGADNIDGRIEALKKNNLALQKKRAEILLAHGYPSDYTDVSYDCPECEDTGFIGTKMCDCFRRELIKNTIRDSGIGSLVDSQSFETFDLKYYADNPQNLKLMKENLDYVKEYAYSFDESSNNLLFIGKTGLGKTHLSTAIAKAAIERGYDVRYDTAPNILSDFEHERFGRTYGGDDAQSRTEIYFTCDLLIIDDLGTELTNSFTVSTLYNLINTRINKKKPILISTNLSPKELRERYESRITSRLFGEFDSLMFNGTDIRQLKLKK